MAWYSAPMAARVPLHEQTEIAVLRDEPAGHVQPLVPCPGMLRQRLQVARPQGRNPATAVYDATNHSPKAPVAATVCQCRTQAGRRQKLNFATLLALAYTAMACFTNAQHLVLDGQGRS